jgi:hypothetical protein
LYWLERGGGFEEGQVIFVGSLRKIQRLPAGWDSNLFCLELNSKKSVCILIADGRQGHQEFPAHTGMPTEPVGRGGKEMGSLVAFMRTVIKTKPFPMAFPDVLIRLFTFKINTYVRQTKIRRK